MITSFEELPASPEVASAWERTSSALLGAGEQEIITGGQPSESRVGRVCPLKQTLLQLLYELVVGMPALAEVQALRVWLRQPEDRSIRLQLLMDHRAANPLAGIDFPLDDAIADWVWRHQRPLIIAAATETRFPEFARRLLEWDIRYFCAVPLMLANRRVGILGLTGTNSDAFDGFDVDFVRRGLINLAEAAKINGVAPTLPPTRASSGGRGFFLDEDISSEDNFEGIIGRSPVIRALCKQVKVVAPTGSTVLILGETGTGKERFAQAIHHLSPRRDRPFVKVNCAAIPAGLIESELFGHERGAFTGAIGRRTGRFEMANGGTLFLDEIGDIPLELQPKLLRVLQEQEFERVGGTQTNKVDVRIVAATSRDLPRMVTNREFRADLFYRLNVFPLRVPPLRERTGDIPLLVSHFVDFFSDRAGKQVADVPAETMEALSRHRWPGNVRELQNVIERAVILSSGRVLRPPLDESLLSPQMTDATGPDRGNERTTLKDMEREHILQALATTNWVLGGPKGAGARLGLARTTLIAKMQKLGISRAQA